MSGFATPNLDIKVVPVCWGSMTETAVTICLEFSGGDVLYFISFQTLLLKYCRFLTT